MNAVIRYIAVVSLSLWIGGLTFYSLFVIPTGTSVVGGMAQGIITQQVTDWLNWIGVASLAIMVPTLRARWMLATWGALAVTLAILFVLHPQLDALLDAKTREIANYGTFYNWHRAYLIVTAAQWLAGAVHLQGIIQSTSTTLPASVT